jgi:hypothetical protein
MTYIIRTSDRGNFKRCRQKWDFESKMRQNWEYTPGIEPLDFGTAIHHALEAYYEPEFWAGDREVAENLSVLNFRMSMNDWRDRMKKAQQWEGNRDKWNELNELGEGMLLHYFMWAPNADRNYRPVKSEIEFEVPIPASQGIQVNSGFSSREGTLHFCGKPVVYQGRIDAIFEDLRDGSLWIVDHKTAAQFGQTEHLELDQQCGSYYWACKKQLGLDIAGVIYSELRKKAPKEPEILKSGLPSKNKSQSTTPEIYRKKLAELGLDEAPYTDFLQTLQNDGQMYFRRIEIHRSEDEIAALEANIVNEAIDMLDNPRIYPNPSRWNCNGCQMRTPCLLTQEGNDAEWFMNNSPLYVRRGGDT